jgi:hypothetical protein
MEKYSPAIFPGIKNIQDTDIFNPNYPFCQLYQTILPTFTFAMLILVARGQGRGLKAGSTGGEDPMKDHFPSAEEGGKHLAVCAPQIRFRPHR